MRRAAVLCLAALACASVALAAPGPLPDPHATSPAAARTRSHRALHRKRAAAAAHRPAAPARAGMVVGIDPETGKLGMPTPEQVARWTGPSALELNHSSEGLVQQRLPDGSVMLDLQGRFREYSIAHMAPGGKPRFDCLGDPAAIRRALADTLATPAVEDR